jgi:TonB family protein
MLGSPKRSALISGLLHAAAIVAILALTGVNPPIIKKIHDVLWIPTDIDNYRPKVSTRLTGGGGGGMRENTPASFGKLPRFAPRQFVPPMVLAVNETPILPFEPTLVGQSDVRVAMLDISQLGLPNGVHGPASAGPGKCCGIGTGEDGGAGPGKGPGAGPGPWTGGVDGGDSRIGGALVAPVLLFKTDPEYSDDARKAKLQGTVVLRIEVNTRGQAQNITVRQSVGLGLDERAIDAVRTWKFKAGTVNGRPAVVTAFVEVNFRLL